MASAEEIPQDDQAAVCRRALAMREYACGAVRRDRTRRLEDEDMRVRMRAWMTD